MTGGNKISIRIRKSVEKDVIRANAFMFFRINNNNNKCVVQFCVELILDFKVLFYETTDWLGHFHCDRYIHCRKVTAK